MKMVRGKKIFRSAVSLALASVLVWTPLSLAVGALDFALEEQTVQVQEEVFCNVKYSKPAICCDVGQKVELTQCGVQFSAYEPMVTQGLRWFYEGKAVKSFTPEQRGTYALTVEAQGKNTRCMWWQNPRRRANMCCTETILMKLLWIFAVGARFPFPRAV